MKPGVELLWCSVRHRCATLRSWVVPLTTVVLGCGTTPPTEPRPAPEPAPTIVPAGIDSSVAAYADSIADVSFVDITQQEQATDLQNHGRALVEESDSAWSASETAAPREVTPDDSARAWEAAAEGGRALVQLDSAIHDSTLDADALAGRTAILLDSAEVALEAAHTLNPFDTRSTLWLSRVYELQARRLGQIASYDRAIEELEKLVRLTPDQHTVFAMLANNHFRRERWDQAALNYQHAEDVYRATYDLVTGAADPLDSSVIYTYIRARADMRVRQLDAGRAATAFTQALAYAPSAEDSAYVIGEQQWMEWDDMNLSSSFKRDSLAGLEQGGDLAEARAGYLALLSALTSSSATDEIDWRLAIVDYNLGNGEDAADRLRALVARAPTDSTGVPIDSTYLRYFNDYGTLLLNVGRTLLYEERDNRSALKYFEQAVHIPWEGRAVAHLEVARLVQSNVEVALENAAQALTNETELTTDQRISLYRLLMGLYRRTGNFNLARHYRDAYRSLQER